MEKRFFTIDEARQALPVVRELVGQAMALSEQLESYRGLVEKLAQSAQSNAGSPGGTTYVRLLMALQQCLGKIQEAGCLVKSVEDGLIDFPHLRGGREVYLCWKYGEDDIHFWHETDAGFAGRTPLLD
ncbi:MAG: DUF2203 domain-containing protein [Acidobacteriota bacterium]